MSSKLLYRYIFCDNCFYTSNGVLDKYCDSEYCAEKALDIVRIENYNKAIDDICLELEKQDLWGHFGLSQLEEIQNKLRKLKKAV